MRDIFSDYIAKINQESFGTREVIASSTADPLELLREVNRKLDRLTQQPVAPATWSSDGVDLVIQGGMVVLPDNGVFAMDVYIGGGKILQLKDRGATGIATSGIAATGIAAPGARIVDARGKYVIPGIIDPHVHLGLFAPLGTELQCETKSALLGGVTTIGVFFGGQQSHLQGFPAIAGEIERLSHTDVIPHLVIGNSQQKREIRDCVRQLGITSFKIYMNGIPGLIPSVDDGFILDVFDELKRSGRDCILCSHTENHFMVERANAMVREEKGENATIQDWSDTHPAMAEEEAVMRIAYLAEQSKMDVYLVHINTKEAIGRLREIRAKNKFVHVETTSPYLSLTKEDSQSNRIKMEPPFRSRSDVEALWDGLRDGIIDTIGTDNVSQTSGEKKVEGSMWDAVAGYPALATHLPVCLHEGVTRRGISIEKLITHMTKRPAETFGVYPQKGTLLPGSDADVVLVDMERECQVNASDLWSRSDFSLYEGKTLKGWPVMTIKGGKILVENGVYVGDGASGRYIRR